jgi:hypothetical protein
VICMDPKDLTGGLVGFQLDRTWNCDVHTEHCRFRISDIKAVLYRRPSPIVR